MAEKKNDPAAALGRYFGGVGFLPTAAQASQASGQPKGASGYPALGLTPGVVQQPALEELFAKSGGSSGQINIKKSETPEKYVVSTYTNAKGEQVAVFNDGSQMVIGQTQDKNVERKSAFDLLYEQFDGYGLGALVEPLRGLIQDNISPSEFTLRLRQTDAYKKRFAANKQRIDAGFRALSEAEYINLEDGYQNVMKRYGLPESYYAKGDLGRQQNLEKFIAGDVSPAELEDRVQTAQNRLINADQNIVKTLRSYYPNITNGDMLAYVLNPSDAINEIKRKVTAAEIGAAAMGAGLIDEKTKLSNITAERAAELAAAGVNKAAAQQGFQTIAEILPRGSQLASIYNQSPYTQTTAEQEVFGLGGATEAAKQRRKLTQLEQASFAGQTGMSGGALGRERAGQY